VDNVVLQCGYGFMESMLEPHAKRAAGMSQVNKSRAIFHLSLTSLQTQVGLTFLIVGALYMLSAPTVGYVSDRMAYSTFNLAIASTILKTPLICLASFLA